MPDNFNISDRPRMAVLDADGLPPDISVETWAALQAIPVGRRVVGRRYGVRQPVCTGGTHGTVWVWTGTLFRPAGRQLVFSSNALVTTPGPTTNEQIIRSTLFDAGVLLGARNFYCSVRIDRNIADTNTATVVDRLGLNGNATDPTIGSQQIVAADRQYNYVNRLSPLNNNEIVILPLDPGTGTSLDARGGNSANGITRSVPSGLSSALYHTVTFTQGATPLATISSRFYFLWVE